MAKQSSGRFLLLGMVFSLLLSGCSDRKPPPGEAQNIRPARMMTVSRASDEVVHEFSARIEALQTVDLSFEVGGPLSEVPVREGESIIKGTLVAALDSTDFQLAVREAEVQLRLAAQDLNRKRKVLMENGIAKSQVEDARSNYELQKVRLSKANERLADTRIQAPFDAYVSRRYFDEYVNIRSGDPIVRLLDLTRIQAVINIPEHLLATVSEEQVKASWIEFPFDKNQRFDITYHENRGEAAAVAQTYEVAFTMENPSQWNILPGMTATVKINLKESAEGHILIPASALIPASNGSLSVWIYDPKTQAVSLRAIETASPIQSGVPVLSGLKNGEQIVVTGASQLQAGMQVRPL